MADNAKAQAKTQAKTVEVYVATHKKIDFALPEYCSRIQVNAERNGQWEGYLHDNDNADDNISLKNPNYCELTALYSMWKNCKADIQGLFHYRRYISRLEKHPDEENANTIMIAPEDVCKTALTQDMIMGALDEADVICVRPFLFEFTMLERQREFCYWHDLEKLRKTIREYFPDYLPALQKVFSAHGASVCNMFIAGREFVDNYCTWLFSVMDKLEKAISIEGYNTQRARVFGYLSEFLLDTYIIKNNLKRKYFCRTFVSENKRERIKTFILMKLRRIPGLAAVVRHLRKSRIKKDIIESDEFSIAVENIYHTDYISGTVTPKDKNFSLESLEEIFRKLEAQYAEKGLTLLPRIILSPETPDSVKEALSEAGIRIMNE